MAERACDACACVASQKGVSKGRQGRDLHIPWLRLSPFLQLLAVEAASAQIAALRPSLLHQKRPLCWYSDRTAPGFLQVSGRMGHLPEAASSHTSEIARRAAQDLKFFNLEWQAVYLGLCTRCIRLVLHG